MKDLCIELEDRPGALAEMGEALGRAGVALLGGGAWVVGRVGVAHFLVDDAEGARSALEAAGLRVRAARDVVVLRLRQGVPGQLGSLARKMSEVGVNVEVQYSDHDHRLILVVDNQERAREVARVWAGREAALGEERPTQASGISPSSTV